MKMFDKWRGPVRRALRKNEMDPVVIPTVLVPVMPEGPSVLGTAIDDVLMAHAKEEMKRVDEAFLVMLAQPGPEKMGLLVETSFGTPFKYDMPSNMVSAQIETTISLSPDVPFGEIRYRTKGE